MSAGRPRRRRRLLVAATALATAVGGLLAAPAAAAPQADPGGAGSVDLSALITPGASLAPGLEMVRRPSADGARRYGRTLKADPGRWRPRARRVAYEWLRDGNQIPGADGRRYEIRRADVGHRLALRVRVRAPRHSTTTTRVGVGRIKHRVGVKRTVRYSIRYKGSIRANKKVFRRQAQRTFDDPRGWRARGVRFVRVKRGGAFTLWLSEARLVPTFSSGCSAEWSCRVGRDVIINQNRWLRASRAWNAGPLGLRAYRHMVVNHETGHWLGLGHASCPGAGRLAPVMMQQSKSRDRCRFNPWPTRTELRGGRPALRPTAVDVG